MTREEEIKNEAYIQEVLLYMDADSFIEGALWADNHPKSPWISVEDDLPYKHKELMSADRDNTIQVLVAVKDQRNNKTIYMPSVMVKLYTSYDEWKWEWANDDNEFKVTHWMPIPKLEEE